MRRDNEIDIEKVVGKQKIHQCRI